MRSGRPEIFHHVPVLLEEILYWLRPHSRGRYLDATVGLGGHAEAILRQSGPEGMLYGLDWDQEALDLARSRLRSFGERAVLIRGNFKDLEELRNRYQIPQLDGILYDLGLSALQVEASERGFSFSRNGPLDMRMDQRLSLKAADLVNHLSEKDLADLFWKFGEERWARRIARRMADVRKKEEIVSTAQLAEICVRAIPPKYRTFRIHPATRTFQALRIAVNRELEGLEGAVRTGVDLLRPGGRVAVISYHSLEDRIVKQVLIGLSKGVERSQDVSACTFASPGEPKVLVLTKKPVTPQDEEIEANPRSRSAKLRVAERV
jgi:16S rRNA (cytosine1402-N4)-methyltransferase